MSREELKKYEEPIESEHEPIWVKALSTERNALMQSRGFPGQDSIPKRTKFDVIDYLVSMEPQVPMTKSKPVSTKKQSDKLASILRKPYKKLPYVLGISSYPSDSRAKYVAQVVMSAAIDAYQADRRRHGARGLPLWHRVYGGLRDPLRDNENREKPSMLIISNIHDESSSIKIEKVRDLLEIYGDIPRIVVSGGQPTADLFSYRLSYPLNAGLYIGPPNLIKEQV
jgi:hypothetical protein